MKYIQSFYQYPVTFSTTGITVPARNAVGEMKNICAIDEKQLTKLENFEPMFRELVNKHKYRILNKIPASYVPPAERINQATSEAERLRKELEETKARLAALEGGKSEDVKEDVSDEDNRESEVDYSKLDYKDLQKMAKDKGIDPNQKKAVLIAELSKADTESAE
jgi:hypothetical protein